ncbi:HNH endonuclease signature motif containing protein [Microbacterium yannicii]|uniref:HNH endonuclease signature motif containing protein n=1 Tax=Microbacterium yannicii TaxID=671622 RepID=UPI0002E10A1E|nr:HNH endonuclease signature motif containing protein [Microbacterium yannicii]
MSNPADTLERLGDALVALVQAAFDDAGLARASDDDVLAVLAAAGRIRRGADALMTEAVAQIVDRDQQQPYPDRLTARHGCRNVGELIQRAARLARKSAGDVVAAAEAVGRPVSLSTGEVLPAGFPGMRAALRAGEVGVDGVVAVAGAFRGCAIGRAQMLAADEELAAAATGEGADAAPPACADELRALATVWATYLDQDGAEPRDAIALRKRGFMMGRARADGLIPVRGDLLPEVAAQLQREFDSVLSPRVDGVPVTGPRFIDQADASDSEAPDEAAADDRTRAQKQHDALAVLLTAAAASGTLPALGGAAPTLIVSVREEDLASRAGFAHVSGCHEPVSIAAARHVACAGAIQRVVLADNGRIVSISTLDRIFNHHQRKAIVLRDGGCVIPGCHVPAEWCEIHHVDEHARGGPTHTDNGALLCWFHHRTIDTGGWKIRMNQGVPEVRGPTWWDPSGRWRPSTTSPTRRHDDIALRT